MILTVPDRAIFDIWNPFDNLTYFWYFDTWLKPPEPIAELKIFIKCVDQFLVMALCDIKIYLIMSEPHCVSLYFFVNLLTNMKVTKIVQKYFLFTFWGFLVTIICDFKIDISMCEPHYVNLFFLWTSSIVHVLWLFDIWHLFDNLTSFWKLDSFFEIWAMGNVGKWVSWLILKIEMGHFGWWGTWVIGHMVNVVMCWIMCNFLNTAWIFTKILLLIDIDVFYLNILWFLHDCLI